MPDIHGVDNIARLVQGFAAGSALLTLLCLAAFILLFKYNRMSIVPGILFDLLLIFVCCSYWGYILLSGNTNIVVTAIAVILFLLPIVFVALGAYGLGLYFFINARAVFKRESHSLPNSLTLLGGIAILLFLVISAIISSTSPPALVLVLWTGILSPIGFFTLLAMAYCTSLLFCGVIRPRYNQDYLIVLGSGLVNGKVPKLLASRIEKALAFANKQMEKTGQLPVLVMSGGKGDDEPLSEAAAMAAYATDKGYNPDLLLTEERSRNTLENMRFSRELIEEHWLAQLDAQEDVDANAGSGEELDANAGSGEEPGANVDNGENVEANGDSGDGPDTHGDSGDGPDTHGVQIKKLYNCAFVSNGFHLLRAGMYARQAGLHISGIAAPSARYFIPNAILREYAAYLVMHKRASLVAAAVTFLLGLLLQIGILVLNSTVG